MNGRKNNTKEPSPCVQEKETIGVTWNSQNYNPNKIGGQIIQGTLNTPLPAYLENPQNRQPRVLLTLSDPTVQVLSLTPMIDFSMAMMASDDVNVIDEEIPGIVEYRYWAELLHEDGTITIEPYSIFEEIEEINEQ